MQYITILDRENLSNKLFITKFARLLSKHMQHYTIVLHGDNEFTESLIQTGMMREDAARQATRELNRRLVGLFADEGVPAISMHGYQRNCITFDGKSLKIDTDYIKSLPNQPVLLLSNIAIHPVSNSHQTVPIGTLANQLALRLNLDEIITFKTTDNLKDRNHTIPDELRTAQFSHRNITLDDFQNLADINKIALTTPEN